MVLVTALRGLRNDISAHVDTKTLDRIDKIIKHVENGNSIDCNKCGNALFTIFECNLCKTKP